jgi:cytochrome oxidase Cu insertion factor (SCO1/SenC/PrrC family)
MVGAALLSAIIPVHGTVLAVTSRHTAVIRNDAVTGTLPSMTRVYRVEPPIELSAGVGVDGFIDRSARPWRWYDAAIAGKFVPGLPLAGKVKALDVGGYLPHTQLVDQNGKLFDLASAVRGKVSLVSFIFTRCHDECPVISANFAAMQRQLDPARFHLVEVTIDPVYDSPSVIAQYARQFGAQSAAWSIVTGQPHEIANLLDRFGISSLRVEKGNLIHNDRLFLSAPDGRITQIVQTSGFTPDSMAAQAKHLAGMVSNPFGRFQLWLIASVTALCGGNQFAGIVALETTLFLIIAAISFVLLSWVARRLWGASGS